MKLLITGGAGCLGSNIIEHFLPKGIEICVIDNFVTGKKEVVPNLSGLTVANGNISDLKLVQKVFKSFKPTHVIHSAASYVDPDDWTTDVNTNIIGTINVERVSRDSNIERFINFQTALCYGRPNQIPIPIDHPIDPFTSYGISKAAGESYLLNSELPVISLRLANICGPRLSIGPIPTFYKRLKENKDCFCSDSVRDFLDMSDFISLIEKIFEGNQSTGAYNVSTGKGNSVYDVFIAVANYLKIDKPEVPIVPIGSDDVQSVVLDPSLTEETFRWKAKVDFLTTINNQLNWYDKYGISAIYSHLKAPKK